MRIAPSFALTACAAALFFAPGLPAQQEPPAAPPPQETVTPSYTVARATSEIKIDGVLDEQAWKDATAAELPYEWYPGNNARPPVETKAYITFDHDTLYVAFEASDPEPSAVRANLMDRDLIGTFNQDDHVGFNLDTFNDERRAFQFRINPRGVQVDAVFSEFDAREDFSWDAIWNSAGRVTATGYAVEVAIPFAQLRFPRSNEPQTWGIEFFRSYPRSVRHRISSRFTYRERDCVLCMENKITGFTGIVPGRNLEITPTVTATREDVLDEFPDGELVEGDEEVEPGITAKWGVTPNVNLSATLNPDFSQVEADALQLAVNTRFALFFPEKRPFFLEGAELYLTPFQAVFTRTVAEPDGGLKVNAKEGRNAFGLFVARDNLTNLIFPANQGSRQTTINDSVDSGVFRYRRDLGARSTVGVLYTGREGDDYHNRVAGLDGFFRFTASDTLRVQYLRSETDYPDAVAARFRQPLDEFAGDGFSVQFDHFTRAWKSFVRYHELDPELRADSGFIPRVDVRTAEVSTQRLFYGTKTSWYAQMIFGAHGVRTEDHTGLLTDQTVELFGVVNGPLQSTFDLTLRSNKEFFAGTTFDYQQYTFLTGFAPTGRTRFNLFIRLGEEIDLGSARLGDAVVINPAVQVRLGKGLNLQLEALRQTLDVGSENAFTATLAESRIVYQWSVRAFVRAILQYQKIEVDPDHQDDLFAQLLFSYKLNPQTVLFAGYTDGRTGFNQINLTQTDRSFFLKIGYAFLY